MILSLFERKKAPSPAAPTTRVRRMSDGEQSAANRTGQPPGEVRRMAPSSAEDIQEQKLRTLMGLRFAEQTIETTGQLSKVVFHQVINEAVRLGQHFYARIAIAQMSASQKTVLLFIDRQKITTDEIGSVLELLRQYGYSLPAQGVQAYDVAPQIVMSLSAGHINQHGLGLERDILNDKSKSSLLASFVEIVAWAFQHQADDIDFAVDTFSATSQIHFKIGGKYVHPDRWNIPTDMAVQILGIAWQKSTGGASAAFELKSEQQAQIAIELPKNALTPEGARLRLRWSSLPMDKGTVVTLRVQRLGSASKIISLEAAGYLPGQIDILKRVNHSEGGIVVYSGVVGSGKTTSLAQLLSMLPRDKKIQSFEDPVELELPWGYQKTISRDLFSASADGGFLAATRALYRSALDVFYLGEVRDQETGLIARQVTESGHSVYTTVHARSGLGIIDRFCSPAIGIPRDVLAAPGILKLLVYQALLPTSCPMCSLPAAEFTHKYLKGASEREAFKVYLSRLHRLYGLAPEKFRFRDPCGCEVCRRGRSELPELFGYEGRTAVAELIEPDEEMLTHIQDGNSIELMRVWRARAHHDFDDPDMEGRTAMECAVYKAGQGLIDPREIESRFMAFETVEMKSLATRRPASRSTLHGVPGHGARAVGAE